MSRGRVGRPKRSPDMTRSWRKVPELYQLPTAYLAWASGMKKPPGVAYPPEGLYEMPRKVVAADNDTLIGCELQV